MKIGRGGRRFRAHSCKSERTNLTPPEREKQDGFGSRRNDPDIGHGQHSRCVYDNNVVVIRGFAQHRLEGSSRKRSGRGIWIPEHAKKIEILNDLAANRFEDEPQAFQHFGEARGPRQAQGALQASAA